MSFGTVLILRFATETVTVLVLLSTKPLVALAILLNALVLLVVFYFMVIYTIAAFAPV